MKQRRIGPFQVSAIGLGRMNLSHAYGAPPSFEDASALLHRALDLGCTLFDTATLYGFGANEELVGKVLAPHRAKFTLASKCGIQGVQYADGLKRVIDDGRPATLRATCEGSLRRLQTDVIDLYYLHRWDKQVPIEDSIGALAELKRAGKIRAIGLSEVSAATLRRAHAVHPITAVQTEYSLWTRNPENLALLDGYLAVAREAGCTAAQLALAWLLARDEHIVPIPGTTRIDHLEENFRADAVVLAPALMQRLDALINQHTVQGARYNSANQAEVDTEEFA